MSRKLGWTLAALVLGAAPLAGGEPVTLAWKFAEGDRFFMERIVMQKQIMEAKKNRFRQESTNRWLSSIKVDKKTPDGYVLSLQIETVERTLVEVDSKKTIPDKLTEKMKGAKFTIALTSAGKITKFDGYEDFIKQQLPIPKADPDKQPKAGQQADLEKTLRLLVPEELLRDAIEEVFGWLPPGLVTKGGDPWKRQAKEPMAPFGHFLSTYDFQYDGVQDGKHAVTAKITTRFQAQPGDAGPIKVLKDDVKGEDGKATYYLAADGKTMEGHKKTALKGKLLVEAAGTQSTFELTSENTTTMRLFTKDDKKAPEKK